MRIAGNDRSGCRLDDICEVRVGEAPPQRVHSRGGEDDIADLPQANQEDAHRSLGNRVIE
jgi:hypothetical protein